MQLNTQMQKKRSDLSDATVRLEGDVEKGIVSKHSEEHFDLREYLTSSNDANQAAGIKHKVIVSQVITLFRVLTDGVFSARWRHLGGFAS